MTTHVNAITFAVKNLALMKHFYTEKFGLEVISENEKVTILKLDNLLLTLCQEALFNQYANISNRAGGKGFYLTINLPSKYAVDERFAELRNDGIQIS
ncbi:VOC family protein [Mucilaginibacter sp. CAU 1740]|uniref:VOC family protein n=1 Tax=Mucilaginibacter sp. CAU 1740 TaxID=3140365 RepID=UPI00325A5116